MLWIPCFIIYWFRGFSLALQLRQFLCHFILRNFVRQVQRKRERARQSGKKRKFITGKREADWPLRRTSVLPFWQSPSYTPPMKKSLKGWSHIQRSGIWWSCSFEKISASEITGCHLGNLVSLKDHCDLFFVCEVGIMSHLISETRVDSITTIDVCLFLFHLSLGPSL